MRIPTQSAQETPPELLIEEPSGHPTIDQLIQDNVRLAQAVESYLLEAEVARGRLHQFVGRLSHDLKAPLRHISSFLNIILDDFRNGTIDKETIQYMEVVSESSVQMSGMIQRLRHLSECEEQALTLEEVDLQQEVTRGLNQIDQVYPNLTVEVSELPVIKTDRNLLRTVLHQLLDNAAKFSSQEEAPVIKITANKIGTYWEIGISDNGIGFQALEKYKLFELFERGESSHEFEGKGLGLAVAARLAERLGTEIRAESEPGHGARFSIRFRA